MSISRPYEGLCLEMRHRLIIVRFESPHLVLSACRANGGLRDDITCLCNQQSCEPAGHMAFLPASAIRDPKTYLEMIARKYGLPAESLAMLSTAANMHCSCTAEESHGDMLVTAVATAGVESNAGRAGDPGAWVETEQGSVQVEAGEPERKRLRAIGGKKSPASGPDTPGTINIMVFFNKELTPGALTSAVIMITEAKTSVMQEFSVSSRYSEGLATGTGTDQVAVACKRGTGKPLANCGKHGKLGELTAKAVRRAVMGSLARQNGMTPTSCCSVAHLLKRHGGDHETLIRHAREFLSPEMGTLFQSNFLCINGDPPTVGYVAGLLHMDDQCSWGVIPEACFEDMLLTSLALISTAVSGNIEALSCYRPRLEEALFSDFNEPGNLTRQIAAALAVGFADKWHWEEEVPASPA